MATGKEISFFSQQRERPAYLSTFQSDVSMSLMVGGTGRNRIGLRLGRFRLIVNGSEEAVISENYLDGIIVGASPGIARIFYAGAYDPTTKIVPECYSADGVHPARDAKTPQAATCAGCPQNELGSRVTDHGKKTRACGFFKRVAFVPLMDPEHRIFQIDLKALSIFGESPLSSQNKFTLSEYAKKLQLNNYDPAHMVTRLSFDNDASVPKLYFSPVRTIEEDELAWTAEAVQSDEKKTIIEISVHTIEGDDLATQATHGAAEIAQIEAKEVVKTSPTVVQAVAKPVQKLVSAPKPSSLVVKTPTPKAVLPPQQLEPVVNVAPVTEISDDEELASFLDQIEA